MTTRTDKLWQRACSLMPGGVSSPVRAFGSVGGTPRIIERAKGSRLYDVEGREYIDYIGSWGAMILGHGHPEVVRALMVCLERGTSYGTPCPQEIELAGEITARMPSIEKIRFVNSGTEAVMSAMRLVRAVTGRELIIKFTGCYHGHADALLVKAGSGVATLGLPDSPGVTRGSVETTLTADYNDLAAVERLFAAHRDAIAAVLVEPIAGNMGVVPGEDQFIHGLRELTATHGALFVFDEVMTGFRVSPGGAQAMYGITPDLTCLGKIIGGGLPVGAYGGRAELMDLVAPAGPVYQAGTLSGNPLAMTAGLATLRALDDAAYMALEKTSQALQRGLEEILREVNTPGVVQRVGSMLTLFLTDKPVRNFADAKAADQRRYAAFFHGMLDRGIHLPPSGYEAWFISAAHEEDAVDRTLTAATAALRAM